MDYKGGTISPIQQSFIGQYNNSQSSLDDGQHTYKGNNTEKPVDSKRMANNPKRGQNHLHNLTQFILAQKNAQNGLLFNTRKRNLHPLNDYHINNSMFDGTSRPENVLHYGPLAMPPVVRGNMDTMASTNMNTLMRYPAPQPTLSNQIPKINRKNNTIQQKKEQK